jgi:hypothetical protein
LSGTSTGFASRLELIEAKGRSVAFVSGETSQLVGNDNGGHNTGPVVPMEAIATD